MKRNSVFSILAVLTVLLTPTGLKAQVQQPLSGSNSEGDKISSGQILLTDLLAPAVDKASGFVLKPSSNYVNTAPRSAFRWRRGRACQLPAAERLAN